MLFCRYCGGKTPDDSLFCTHCGHPMQPSLEQEAKVNEPYTPLTMHTLPSDASTLPSQPLQPVPPHDSAHEEDEEQQIIPPVVPPEAPTTGSIPSVQGIPQVGTVPSIPVVAGTVATTLTAGTLVKVVVVLAVCAAVIFTGVKAIPPILYHSTPTTSITPVTKTLPVPPTQTSCPAPGTARAAVTAPLVLGKHQNLIYTTNETQFASSPLPDTLKRYDVTTGQKTDIAKLDTSATSTQVSADGQWVLFATLPSSIHEQAAIQMIRMDGQGLQTLYCNPAKYNPTSNYELASINSIAWSTDQKLVMFTEGDNSNNPPSLYLLNLVKGTIQKELQPDPNSSISYSPRVWVDNTHVALFASASSGYSQEESIYVLDTNKGANQQSSNLHLIVTASTSCFGFDISTDHTAFFLYRCTQNSSQSSRQGPSSISMLPITGGAEHTIFTTQTLSVESIGVISNTSLLVIVGAGGGNKGQNGLYTMHIDGTGFTKLIGYDVLGIDLRGFVFEFHQFSPWSIVSRDGHMYAVGLIHSCGMACSYSLLVGPLSGGNITNVASGLNTSIAIAGWTTM